MKRADDALHAAKHAGRNCASSEEAEKPASEGGMC